MRVEWTRQALANLEDHFDHVASENLDAARRIFTRVVETVERLGRFPSMGRISRVTDTRELYVSGTPYIVPYRVHNDTVEILRLLHSSQEWPKKL
ncbi:MAG: type II toxin-antitoxin system RelE/ParE family toxin [Candidatus Binataceae bacterium]